MEIKSSKYPDYYFVFRWIKLAEVPVLIKFHKVIKNYE